MGVRRRHNGGGTRSAREGLRKSLLFRSIRDHLVEGWALQSTCGRKNRTLCVIFSGALGCILCEDVGGRAALLGRCRERVQAVDGRLVCRKGGWIRLEQLLKEPRHLQVFSSAALSLARAGGHLKQCRNLCGRGPPLTSTGNVRLK